MGRKLSAISYQRRRAPLIFAAIGSTDGLLVVVVVDHMDREAAGK
jgi:hypothetical protein